MRRMKRTWLLIIGLTALLILAGCGGGAPAEELPRRQVRKERRRLKPRPTAVAPR